MVMSTLTSACSTAHGCRYYINCVGCPLTDFSLEAAREFWIQEYLNTTREYSGVFDGLFADRAAGAPKGCRNESGYVRERFFILVMFYTDSNDVAVEYA